MTISGSSFGDAPRVLINDVDKTDHIDTSSDSEIKLFGKAKKLALRSGENTIQIVTADNATSNVFKLTL
jgi:hypothetical protein